MNLTQLEQEINYLCVELDQATPDSLPEWMEWLKSWFEVEDQNKERRQQFRKSLASDKFQYPDPTSPCQPTGCFMQWYKKDATIALEILREWAKISSLKTIPAPSSPPVMTDRWDCEKFSKHKGLSEKDFNYYFGGRRFS